MLAGSHLLVHLAFKGGYDHLSFSQLSCQPSNLHSFCFRHLLQARAGPEMMLRLNQTAQDETKYKRVGRKTYSLSLVSACSFSISYLSSPFLYLDRQILIQRPERNLFVTNLTVKSSTVLLRMSSLDLKPATTSLVLSYFRCRSLKARSTACRSSRICALSVCNLQKWFETKHFLASDLFLPHLSLSITLHTDSLSFSEISCEIVFSNSSTIPIIALQVAKLRNFQNAKPKK